MGGRGAPGRLQANRGPGTRRLRARHPARAWRPHAFGFTPGRARGRDQRGVTHEALSASPPVPA
eukprot:4592543-Pyramimonas_sp.AAC.1